MSWTKFLNPIPVGAAAAIAARKAKRRQRQLDEVARERESSEAKNAEKADRLSRRELSKNQMALQSDVERLEGKSNSQFDSVKSSISNLSKSTMRREQAIRKASDAIENGIDAEERASSRIAKKMQSAFSSAIGGGQMSALITKATRDGKLTMSESASLTSGIANFAVSGFNALRKEVALNEGAIVELSDGVESLQDISKGIDSNARALSGLSTSGVKSGIFDSGDALDNLANGAFFWRGKRIDLIGLFLSWVSIKGCTVYEVFDRDDEDFADWLMSDKDPAMLVVGSRLITTGNETVLDSDAPYGYTISGGALVRVEPVNGAWATGTKVEKMAEVKIAPNINTVLKNAGSFGIFAAGNRWYTTLVPLFSEKLGSVLGLGDGADIVNNKAS
jgi:hypothetical protein